MKVADDAVLRGADALAELTRALTEDGPKSTKSAESPESGEILERLDAIGGLL